MCKYTEQEVKEAKIKLPLRFDKESDTIYDGDGAFLEPWGKNYYQPKIDYVIRACNNHDELVETLKNAIDLLKFVCNGSKEMRDDISHYEKTLSKATE